MTTKIIQVWKVNLRMKAQGFWEFVDTSNSPIGELSEDVAQLADCFPGHAYRVITRTPIYKTNHSGVRVLQPESHVRQRIDVIISPVVSVPFTVSKPKF